MWGDDFHKKFQILEKIFILFHLIFLCFYCCSINVKRQSEHSGLRPDTSSLVGLGLEPIAIQQNFHLNACGSSTTAALKSEAFFF